MITKEQKRRFVDLACDLSPENLSCDGELSGAETDRRRAHVLASWAALEHECGQSVPQETVDGWMMEGTGV